MDVDGKQLIAVDDEADSIELGSAGAELVIKSKTDSGVSAKILGSREFLRYYKQKPRPAPANDMAITMALAARFVCQNLFNQLRFS